MKLTLLGTRGSFPHIEPDMVAYGGNTSCVEVIGQDGTVILLDAGTGIRRAWSAVDSDLRRMDILLSHFHMDHVQGLGFFAPLFRADMEVHIWGPPSTTLNLHRRLARYLSPPLFPVTIRDFECKLVLHDAPRGKFQIGCFEVQSDLVCHPGPTMGYRITEDATAITYLPDHELALGAPCFPEEPNWTSGMNLAEGVDLLLHDCQYDEQEHAERIGWGHSTPAQAVAFAREAGVDKLIAFHHDPNHDDARIDQMIAEAQKDAGPVDIIGGKDGDVLDLRPRAPGEAVGAPA
jgi:ribonuclease BN (tRNA processing enzyme)